MSAQVVRDNDEPSLYFTRALFGDSVPLSSVFTSSKGLRGLRVTSDKMLTNRWQSKPYSVINQTLYGNAGFLLSYGPLTSLASMPIADQSLVGFGKLVGVEEPSSVVVPSVILPELKFGTSVFASTAQYVTAINQTNAALAERKNNVDLFQHFGGGILGSQVFIHKNTNLSSQQISPGSDNLKDAVIARRISFRVFQDLLCHQMPTLTEEDVRGDVVENSPHSFRTNSSCMACHTSMDPFAYNYRNVIPYKTSTNYDVPDNAAGNELRKKGTPLIGFTNLPEVLGSEVFSLQKPSGSLNYRDHANNLIKRPVANLSELGLELSNSDDFYRCTVKKYYSYLTGFDVGLAPRNVAEINNTKAAQFHRSKVYGIAANLKKHQSMKQMIKEIMQSEAFVYRNYQGL